ncbi:hypothetical protein CFP66_45880 [Pseudonocardia sp. MH-G8]|nr:hypothetical protein CFP66_45880 [Pseudonocardia sp. MH-G8]
MSSARDGRVSDVSRAVSRGANFPAFGEYNEAVILDAVRRAASDISRVELAQITGLSAQTVSKVTRRLISAGIVREKGTVSNGPGKPRTILELDAKRYYAVGVHLDPAVLTCVLLDLVGGVVARRSVDLREQAKPDALIGRITDVIDDVVASVGIEEARVLGVGIASPGPLDSRTGIVSHPPHLREWGTVPLRAALIEKTGYSVLVERDVTAAVVAELWAPVDDAVADFLFLYYGTGVNAGIALGRDVVRGVNGRAGAAGHVSTGPGGEPCFCGRDGCLDSTCTPEIVVRKARDLGLLPSRADGAEGSASSLLADMTALVAQVRENPQGPAATLLAETGRRIGRAVATLVAVIDVTRVVLGGPFWEVAESALVESLQSVLRTDAALHARGRIEIVGAAVGTDVAATGAACLVLDNAFSRRPSSILLAP